MVTPKKNQSQICLNVGNTSQIHPTKDDLVNELSTSMVFLHLDMSKGYHQLELKENSRNVSAFSTHIGLYRYKRLNYSARSAA